MNKDIKNGFKRVQGKPILLLVIVLFVAVMVCITPVLESLINMLEVPFSADFFKIVLYVVIVELAIVLTLGIIAGFGKPNSIEKKLKTYGFVDKQGDSPMLISKKRDKNGYVYEFYSPRIPFFKFEDYRADIETALNIKIVEVLAGKDMQHVIVKAISGSTKMQSLLKWDDKFLSDTDGVLLLGESYLGQESLDLSVYSHVLCGGGSNSGKTVLIKLMLMQAIKKGMTVFLIDLKGGVDFPLRWHEACSIITNPNDAEKTLDDVLQILEDRRALLVKAGCTNIEKYNKESDKPLNRIIVACDEIAELLDRTGLDKEQKALVDRIESKISTIARTGRFAGIHLICATQRPDHEILKGQIKNNISFRICGRCDKVLSQIILDSSEGAEKILPSDQGVFLTNTGTLFKAYYIEDNCLEGVDFDGNG